MIEFLGIVTLLLYSVGFFMLIISVIGMIFQDNEYVIKGIDFISSFSSREKKLKAEKEEADRKEKILKNGSDDEKVELLNEITLEEWKNKKPSILHNNSKPYLLLKKDDVIKKYPGIDFNKSNVFIVKQPNVLFSLEEEKIINNFDLVFDENTNILKNKNITPINIETIKTDDIKTYMKTLSYDYLFIYGQDIDEKIFRFKTLLK